MFVKDNLFLIASGFPGDPNLYTYNSEGDNLATVAAPQYFNDGLTILKTGDKVAITTGIDGLAFSGTFRNNGVEVFLDFDHTLIIQNFLTDVSTLSNTYCYAPAGVVIQVGGVLDTAITVAPVIVSFELDAPITGGSIAFTTAMSAGTIVTATPTALNSQTVFGVLSIVSDGASTTASRGNFFAKMVCPSDLTGSVQ